MTPLFAYLVQLYGKVKSLTICFEWMSLFLASMEAPPTATPTSEETTLEILSQASSGLPGLWFASSERFTSKAVAFSLHWSVLENFRSI